MVATAATSSFFPVPSGDVKAGNQISGLVQMVPTKSKQTKISVATNAQAPPRINGSTVETLKAEDETFPSPPPRTFINQLPDWSMLLAAITTVFLAAEKQWMMLDWKPRRSDTLMDSFGLGRIDGLIFRQNFSIRSYEIGVDRNASIETLMNHLQETALNHVMTVGLLGDGFGSTPEMVKRNLIWVVAKMQVQVDRYPKWGDVVQVDTWVDSSGKNGMRRDWLLRDARTGDTLTRASSVWVMMNKLTRRLSKIPEEVRQEIGSYFVDSDPVIEENGKKLAKLDDSSADYISRGLTPKWKDLDVNQHVNNVKYIGWIFESAPHLILERCELAGMTLEYRRECGRDNVLDSLTAVTAGDAYATHAGRVECQHLLRLEDGSEIVRGRTEWRCKKRAGAVDGESTRGPFI